MARGQFRWKQRPTTAFKARVYVVALERGVEGVLNSFAPDVEGDAKRGAEWTDRTGNARQTLAAFAYRRRVHLYALVLRQTMDYGVFLELSHGGQYAIVLRTLEQYYADVWQAVKRLING